MIQRATEIGLDAGGFPLPPDVGRPEGTSSECAIWRRVGSTLSADVPEHKLGRAVVSCSRVSSTLSRQGVVRVPGEMIC